MRFWATTVLIMVLACNLLMILLSVVLSKREWMISVGYKTASGVAFLILLRMLTPFELPVTTNIYFPYHLSTLMSEFGYARFRMGTLEFSLWNIAEAVWALGIAFYMVRFWKSSRSFREYVKHNGTVPVQKDRYEKCVQRICKELKREKEFQILEMEAISVPVVWMRKKPCILLPAYVREFSEQELYYILRHEMLHFFYHDFWLKYLIQFISIVYWWNPFGKKLRKQCEMLLEMRVDDKLAGDDSDTKAEYLSCLLQTVKRSRGKQISQTAIAFCGEDSGVLTQRFQMLLESGERTQRKTVLKTIVVGLAVAVYIFSMVFIFETDYIPPEILQDDTYIIATKDNAYIVDHGDGTYTLYFDDWGDPIQLDSIEYYEDVPVYKEEEVMENENMFEKAE